MLTFEELHLEGAETIFQKIDEACRLLNIDYFLIGAQAVNFHLYRAKQSGIRLTKDIDFAVLVPNFAVYNDLLGILLEDGLIHTQEPYRLFYPSTDTIIDLLPFGGVELNGTVTFGADFQISVVGLREVNHYASGESIQGATFRISPSSGLFLLKFISNADRPERVSDLDDINSILDNYFDLHSDRFFNEHLDLIDELKGEAYFIQEAGACLLGRDLRKILDLSPSLRQAFYDILLKELRDQPHRIGNYFVQKGYFETWADFKRVFSLIYRQL